MLAGDFLDLRGVIGDKCGPSARVQVRPADSAGLRAYLQIEVSRQCHSQPLRKAPEPQGLQADSRSRVAGPAFELGLGHFRAVPDGQCLEAAPEGATRFTGDQTHPLINTHIPLQLCKLQTDPSIGVRDGGIDNLGR